MDSLPLRILPELRQVFPTVNFEIKDPNEEWDSFENARGELVVIDTVIGLKDVAVFDDFDSFAAAPRLTMHDFDALANLKYLKKLGKLKEIKVIGVPPDMDQARVISEIRKILK